MSQNSNPLITIVGALSKQGRSVARTLLHSGRYRVRALTRRVDTPEAQSLARHGAELNTVPHVQGGVVWGREFCRSAGTHYQVGSSPTASQMSR
jgi:hypothetical protein